LIQRKKLLIPKVGWCKVRHLRPSAIAARMAELGIAPGSVIWIQTYQLPPGTIYVATQDGGLVMRIEEFREIELEELPYDEF